jgi:hypothetical protein
VDEHGRFGCDAASSIEPQSTHQVIARVVAVFDADKLGVLIVEFGDLG